MLIAVTSAPLLAIHLLAAVKFNQMVMSETKQGICLECEIALSNPNSFGYHSHCADIAHERSNKEADKNFPFVVVGFDGAEIDRFKSEDEAEEFLYNIKNAEIERR